MNAHVIMSACLAGQPCRYDGCSQKAELTPFWLERIADGRVTLVCPEMLGGLPSPRPPAEIAPTASASTVLAGIGSVLTKDGTDVTQQYIQGAQATVAIAQQKGARIAILKSKSPSCGTRCVYDGTHTKQLRAGQGVTAQALVLQGIALFDETELDQAQQAITGLETGQQQSPVRPFETDYFEGGDAFSDNDD